MTDLLELRNYLRARTNTQQNFALSDETANLFINSGLGGLHTILATDYEDYGLSRYMATITTGNQIPLPPDFMKLRAVDFGSPGMWTTVFGYNLQERNRNNNPIANMVVPFGNLAARKCRVMGNRMYIEPEQLASGQYQIWYTPKFALLKSDTQTVDPSMDINFIIEYAIASAAVKVYNMLNLDVSGFVQEVNYYEDQVRNLMANRMNNGPECVVNVTNISDWSFPMGGGLNGGGWP